LDGTAVPRLKARGVTREAAASAGPAKHITANKSKLAWISGGKGAYGTGSSPLH
jgi:hypothetical protein